MTPHTDRPGTVARPGEDPLDRLMAERGTHLLHAAIALTGSQAEAEDLLQAAVERLHGNRWHARIQPIHGRFLWG